MANSRYVADSAAAKSLSVYVIMKGKNRVGRVLAKYTSTGCLVNVFDSAREMQVGRASGYGYDKFTAALAGLTFDGHVLTDHCSRHNAPKRKGAYYPNDMKCPKGYSFANAVYISKATGAVVDRFAFTKKAADAARIAYAGWSDCYRDPGLKYLEAKGYTVIQAL